MTETETESESESETDAEAQAETDADAEADAKSETEALAPRAGTGTQVGRTPVGQPGSRERVVLDDVIGDYVDTSGVAAPTRVGIIHYSRGGIHIVPARPQ